MGVFVATRILKRRERWFLWPASVEPISAEAFDRTFYRAHQGEYSHIVIEAQGWMGSGGQELVARIQRTGIPLVVRLRADQLEQAITESPSPSGAVQFEVVFLDWDEKLERGLERLAKLGEVCQLTWQLNRTVGLLPVIEKIPEHLWPQLRFLCPYKITASDPNYSIAEVARVLEDLSLRYPALQISPPLQYEISNPQVDRRQEREPLVTPSIRTRPYANSPVVSYIIPTYNNSSRLLTVLRNLMEQTCSAGKFEVLVVDDGSVDGTEEVVRSLMKRQALPFGFTYLYFPRGQSRRMGDTQFRAGLARNLGVKWADGEILCFQDSDILVPPTYTNHLIEAHKDHDLIQPCRVQVKGAYSKGSHLAKDLRDESFLERQPGGYWDTFQERTVDWNDDRWRWRHVSTFCLSIKKEHFKALGWFKQTFTGYGFEDTDLGLRAHRAGLSFLLSREQVYHLKHPFLRSEYFHSPLAKDLLLSRSIPTFYLNNLDRDIFLALQIYFDREMLKTKWKEKVLGKLRSPTANRWNQSLLGREEA